MARADINSSFIITFSTAQSARVDHHGCQPASHRTEQKSNDPGRVLPDGAIARPGNRPSEFSASSYIVTIYVLLAESQVSIVNIDPAVGKHVLLTAGAPVQVSSVRRFLREPGPAVDCSRLITTIIRN